MAIYQNHEVMLETLKKVQPFQVEIIKAGLPCHLDGGMYRSKLLGDHIGFDVTVFEGNEIVRQFEFSADMSQAELDAEIASMAAYVDRIKNEED